MIALLVLYLFQVVSDAFTLMKYITHGQGGEGVCFCLHMVASISSLYTNIHALNNRVYKSC